MSPGKKDWVIVPDETESFYSVCLVVIIGKEHLRSKVTTCICFSFLQWLGFERLGLAALGQKDSTNCLELIRPGEALGWEGQRLRRLGLRRAAHGRGSRDPSPPLPSRTARPAGCSCVCYVCHARTGTDGGGAAVARAASE